VRFREKCAVNSNALHSAKTTLPSEGCAKTSNDQFQQPFANKMVLNKRHQTCKWLLKLTFTGY